MENDDLYQEFIEETGRMKKWELKDLAIYINNELKVNNELISAIIPFRKQFLVDEDKNAVYYFLCNYFTEVNGDDLISICSIVKEIYDYSLKKYFALSFEKYNQDQLIFKEYPELFEEIREKRNGNKDFELINLKAVNYRPIPNVKSHNFFKYNNHFIFVDDFLDIRIVSFLIEKYGVENLYIRLNPFQLSNESPKLSLQEEFLRPPNPMWIENISIYPGKTEGASLFIPALTVQDVCDKRTRLQFTEFHEQKIRTLQSIATMKLENGKKHLSMSIEELSDEYEDLEVLIGRMIHLDVLYSNEESFYKIKLNHLDLAVNVYEGEDALKRKSSDLSMGEKIVGASYRTHLIRADSISFSDLLIISKYYFKSATMINDWINYHFK